MKYQKGAHRIYYLRSHPVFSTRYRRNILTHGVGYLQGMLAKSFQRRHPEIQLLEMHASTDHAHLRCIIPLKMSISHAMRLLKGYSAHAMRLRFPFLDRVSYGSDGIWSDGSFVSTARYQRNNNQEIP